MQEACYIWEKAEGEGDYRSWACLKISAPVHPPALSEISSQAVAKF